MQSTTELYRNLLHSDARKELRLVIAGTEYTESDIISCTTSGGLFDNLSIGNAVARQIDLEILPKGTIPRQARIEVYVRLTDGSQSSEWIQKGVYFFSTRELDRSTGVLTVHGYDAMLKADDTWLDGDSYDEESWPMPVADAVADIAARMGVEVDPRTTLNAAHPVQYPVGAAGEMTMREVLQQIAVANAGNWIITDQWNEETLCPYLRLVPLVSIPQETNYLVTEHGDAILIGGVRIVVGGTT